MAMRGMTDRRSPRIHRLQNHRRDNGTTAGTSINSEVLTPICAAPIQTTAVEAIWITAIVIVIVIMIATVIITALLKVTSPFAWNLLLVLTPTTPTARETESGINMAQERMVNTAPIKVPTISALLKEVLIKVPIEVPIEVLVVLMIIEITETITAMNEMHPISHVALTMTDKPVVTVVLVVLMIADANIT